MLQLKQWIDARRYSQAEHLVQMLLKEDPMDANARHALGLILLQKGDVVGATQALEQASASLPNLADVWLNLSSAYRHGERLGPARTALERALALQPNHLAALLNGASLCNEQEDFAAGEHYARRAIQIDSLQIAGHTALARALACTERSSEALEVMLAAWAHAGGARRSLARDIVSLMLRLNQPEAAWDFCKQCLAQDTKGESEYLALQGDVLFAKDAQVEALALFRKIFENKKTHPSADAIFSFAVKLLATGTLAEGWRLHRNRHRIEVLKGGSYQVPYARLEGGNFANRKIFLWAEQGVADEIWYASLLPEILAAPGERVIAVGERLISIFERSFPGVRFVKRDVRTAPPLGDFRPDWHAPYADAAEWLRPDMASFSHQPIGYLKPDPAKVALWASVLPSYAQGKPIIGLSWRSTRDKRDAIGFTYPRLREVAELVRSIDACWVNLQYDDPNGAEAADIARLAGKPLVTLPDFDLKDDFEAHAAVFANMAAVVGPANAPVVLAAAIGRPTVSFWTRSLRIGWRKHGLNGRTPWFANMRLAERRMADDWSSVMTVAQQELLDILQTSVTP